MRVTTKGQVTIPLKIRKKLDITPSTEVEFVLEESGRVYLKKVEKPTQRAKRFSKLRGIATVHMTTEEIMALTRAET